MVDNKIGIMIGAFIVLILGIVLADVVADTNSLASATYTVNETVTLTNGTAVNLANNWVTSVSSVVANNGTANVTLTPTTDYTNASLESESVGTITLLNGDYDGNSSYITYNYNDDNFVNNSQARTLINLIIIFFVLGILGMAVALGLKMGIMDI